MKQYILAVLDEEEIYARRLVEYLNRRKEPLFFAEAFTGFASLQEFVKDHAVKVLLLHTACWNEKITELGAEKIVLLSDGIVPEGLPQQSVLYKYQAADCLYQELLNCCSDIKFGGSRAQGTAAEILSVYSPVKQSRNTCFAVVMGMELAKRKRVLYLNLEPFSSFLGLYETLNQHNLSDLMYFLKQDGTELFCELKNTVFKIKDLDCVMPAQAPMDIQSFMPEDWEWLLSVLKESSGYEILVLEFGEEVRGFADILGRSDLIYMPIWNELLEQEKIRQFENFIEKTELFELKERIRRISIPCVRLPLQKEYYFEQLEAGPLGGFVREVLEQDGL